MPRATKYGKWRETDMAEALLAIRKRGLGLNKAAKQYAVPKATLKRHLDGKNRFAAEERKFVGRSSDIPIEIETLIKQHVLSLEPGIVDALTSVGLRRLAFRVAEDNGLSHRFNRQQEMAGKSWFYSFMRRHPELTRVTGFGRRMKDEASSGCASRTRSAGTTIEGQSVEEQAGESEEPEENPRVRDCVDSPIDAAGSSASEAPRGISPLGADESETEGDSRRSSSPRTREEERNCTG